MTCANTAWRHRARSYDLRIKNEQAAYPCTTWHKMCHLALLRDGSGGTKADPKPLTSTNASGPRRARTDDLRIKRAIRARLERARSAISCVVG